VHSAQCAVYSEQCTMYSAQCTVYSAQFTVHSAQCRVHSEQCIVYSSSDLRLFILKLKVKYNLCYISVRYCDMVVTVRNVAW